jgi:endonuclease/exonuclease/phosphatase family metal-dependent hydrolase
VTAETLRLASLNVWALPFGLARHAAARMEAIGERLPALALDVAAFQEVWTDEARAALVAAGARAGLDHVWHRPEAFGGSGLLLLARRPLGDVAFHRYALAGLPQRIHHGDYWSGKGFVVARLETEAGPLALAATHLHAQYTPDPEDEYRGIRTAQVIELAAALRERPEPVVALGDFNLRTGNPDHAVLIGLTGLTDVALALDHPQDTVMSPHPYRGGGHRGGERIDYAFVRTGRSADAVPRRIERIFDAPLEIDGEAARYSDHAGLLVEVEVRPVAPRVLPAADPRALARARALLGQGRAEASRRRGIERSLALGTAAVAAAALPAASQLRASRRRFLAGLVAGLGVTCVPGALAVGALAEVAVPRELSAYDRVEALLDGFVPAS